MIYSTVFRIVLYAVSVVLLILGGLIYFAYRKPTTLICKLLDQTNTSCRQLKLCDSTNTVWFNELIIQSSPSFIYAFSGVVMIGLASYCKSRLVLHNRLILIFITYCILSEITQLFLPELGTFDFNDICCYVVGSAVGLVSVKLSHHEF